MSTMRRQQRAIEGNTARKVQTLEYPSRERQPERRERRHAEKSNVQQHPAWYSGPVSIICSFRQKPPVE